GVAGCRRQSSAASGCSFRRAFRRLGAHFCPSAGGAAGDVAGGNVVRASPGGGGGGAISLSRPAACSLPAGSFPVIGAVGAGSCSAAAVAGTGVRPFWHAAPLQRFRQPKPAPPPHG